MSEQEISKYVKASFLKSQLFILKVNVALRNCEKIKRYLKRNDKLSKSGSKLSLITSDGISNKIENSYLLYRQYNNDGSMDPIKKYAIVNGKIKEHCPKVKHDIIVLDLYEKSIYLHSYIKDSNHITGFLIKEKIKSQKDKSLIFSNEIIKINLKNINKFEEINVIEDFVSSYII